MMLRDGGLAALSPPYETGIYRPTRVQVSPPHSAPTHPSTRSVSGPATELGGLRAQQRRHQLLEVAANLFARLGYRGTTTAELAKAARGSDQDGTRAQFIDLVELAKALGSSGG